jgi:hypothetical protein
VQPNGFCFGSLRAVTASMQSPNRKDQSEKTDMLRLRSSEEYSGAGVTSDAELGVVVRREEETPKIEVGCDVYRVGILGKEQSRASGFRTGREGATSVHVEMRSHLPALLHVRSTKFLRVWVLKGTKLGQLVRTAWEMHRHVSILPCLYIGVIPLF